jgi:hypothetical protein
LEAFAAELFDGFFRADQRRWGQAYVRGLLLDGRRKSVEPMAARLGGDGNRQALAHFITSSPWDAAHVRARLAWKMQDAIGPEALIVDDTGFLKDGDASACVARQYTGTAGKVTRWVCRCTWPTTVRRPRSTGGCSCRPAGTRLHPRPIRPRSPVAVAAASPPRRGTWRSGSWPWT